MNNQLTSNLYHLDIHDVDYEVAHIYEHMLIQTFLNSLTGHDESRYLSGWVDGETFRKIMFINGNFYNVAVADIFATFIASHHRIDMSLLDNELLRIQAEDTSVIEQIDRDNVIEQLTILDTRNFVDHAQTIDPQYIANSDQLPAAEIVKLHRDKKSFRQIAVAFGVRDTSLIEKTILLRLAPIIYDMIDDCLFSMGAYNNGSSAMLDRTNNGQVGVTIYTIRRGIHTSRNIRSSLVKIVPKLIADVQAHPEKLAQYSACFVTTPTWSTFPITYYRWSGMLTSRVTIAKLLTPDAVVKTLSKLEFKVSPAKPGHFDVILE